MLTKKWHTKADGELVMQGHIKPLQSVNTLDIQSPDLMFCAVRECLEAAQSTCNYANGNESNCEGLHFCNTHGPDHQLHGSFSYKSVSDWANLGLRCKEEMLRKAIVRVQDLLEKKEAGDKKNKAIKIKKVADIKSLIQNKDEVRTEVTSRKVRDKEKVKAKNQIFLQNVEESLTFMSLSNKEDDIMIDNTHTKANITVRSTIPPALSFVPTCTQTKHDLSNDAGMQVYKKVKLDNELSVPDQHLKKDVDRIISLAHDKRKAHSSTNFDVDMERCINQSYYWTNLHKLLDLYNLPTDQETKDLISIGFVGSNNDSNRRRVIFIDRICQLLREAKIVTVEKVTSTRSK
jgi:hypothetical protein